MGPLREEKSFNMNSSLLLLGFVSFVTSFPQGISSGQSSDGLAGHSGSGSGRSVKTTQEMKFFADIPPDNSVDILNILEAENDDDGIFLPVMTDGGFQLDGDLDLDMMEKGEDI